jgi:hypothetical protein
MCPQEFGNNEESKGIGQETLPAKDIKPSDKAEDKSFSFKLVNPFDQSIEDQVEDSSSIRVNDILL